IRDGHVTGVQTCALPIFLIGCTRSAAATVYLANHDLISSTRRRRRTWRWTRRWRRYRRRRRGWKWSVAQADGVKLNLPGASEIRSEERRVGKECRSQ